MCKTPPGNDNGKHQVNPGQEPEPTGTQISDPVIEENGDTAYEEVDVPSSGSERDVPVLFGTKRLPDTLSALNVYLAKLRDVEILPIDEQARLAEDYQTTGNKEAAAKLVASNLRLVVKIAFQFRRQWADVMDLVAEGNVGLAEAIKKFDVERGIPFPSYARFWIRARILAFIQENKHLVHAGSRAARKLFWRLDRERRHLIQEGLEPTAKLLAERVGVTEADVTELAPILDHRPVSLDRPARPDDDGPSRADVLPDTAAITPEQRVSGAEVQDALAKAFQAFRETLDERDGKIWDKRLQSDEPLRLEDLGNTFGVSKERVRQLETRIKQRLKQYLQKHLGEDVIVEALRYTKTGSEPGGGMRALKRLKHTWPKRGPAERRLHPRLRARIPVVVDPGKQSASLSCWTADVTVGGLKLLSERYLDVFTFVNIAFEVPITGRDGEVSVHLIEVVATVMRISPDDPDEEVEAYEVALKFNGRDDTRDGLIANYMLQMHLYDPGSNLV